MAIAAPEQLNISEVPAWGSRSVDCFEKLEQIGEGTYGQVYMAKEIETGEIVALKKIRMDNEREGFPITAIREIKILKKLPHENVIKLKEIVTSTRPEKDEQGAADGNKYKGGIYMVFEYMDHDLTGLADRPGIRFSVPQIKCYMRQLLTGLHYCHVNQVLHRDIKGSNLLIDNEGNLKLADFGLARSFSGDHNANLTNRVITLWYRPPELLLGTTKYGPAVDLWSVGCIFAELLNGKPIFPGKDEPEQLNKIFDICGAPTEEIWPGVSKIPWYNNFKPSRPLKRRLREHFKHFDRHALDLLERMLTLDPSQRISAKDALDAEYFWTDPLPCDPKSLPKYESSHEFQTKKKRQQQRQQEENTKRQKLHHQHQQQHSRLPPIQQSGHGHSQMRPGPNPSSQGPQPQVAAGVAGHHYGNHVDLQLGHEDILRTEILQEDITRTVAAVAMLLHTHLMEELLLRMVLAACLAVLGEEAVVGAMGLEDRIILTVAVHTAHLVVLGAGRTWFLVVETSNITGNNDVPGNSTFAADLLNMFVRKANLITFKFIK